MDIGVGYFILCNSMRLIRNSDDLIDFNLRNIPNEFYSTVKKSSLLFLIGFIRLVLVKLTNYSVSVDEYGEHWNFFFTVFFVRVNKIK